MFGLGNQQRVGEMLGQGCPQGGCKTASHAYSGVYSSGASPYQKTSIGALPFSYNVLQPGLNQPMPTPPQPVMGTAPIGNYMITQSVPTPPSPPPPPPPPQVGANATVVDMGLTWKICEPVDFGFGFRQLRCRNEPKFR